jgi:hypothetical protein
MHAVQDTLKITWYDFKLNVVGEAELEPDVLTGS